MALGNFAEGFFIFKNVYLYCMVIDIYQDLWLRVSQYAQKYMSGAQNVATFNGALSEVQNEVFSMLSPYYSTNEKVRGLLAVWVKSINATATNGVYSIPSGSNDPQFDRVISLAVTDGANPPNIQYEINPISEGELVYVNRLPQRKPDLTKKRVYFLVDAPTTINFFPKVASLPFFMYYIVFPTEAKIAFTYTETDDEDVMTYDSGNSVQLQWTKDARNLILYKMLEKYGVTVREQLLQVYAQLGISEMLSQPNNGGKQ